MSVSGAGIGDIIVAGTGEKGQEEEFKQNHDILSEENWQSSLAEYVNLTNRLGAHQVMEVSMAKMVAEHVTLWDLMLSKASLGLDGDAGVMDALLEDLAAVLVELRSLIRGCLAPARGRRSRYKRAGGSARGGERRGGRVVLDDALAAALALPKGEWQMRELDEIGYSHPLLRPETLFAERTQDPAIEPAEHPVAEEKCSDQETDAKVAPEGDGARLDDGQGPAIKEEVDSAKPKARPNRKRRRPKKPSEDVEGEPESLSKTEATSSAPDYEETEDGTDERQLAKTSRANGKSDFYLCLKCGQKLCKAYGKQHEARCNGFHVRHPEYKKVDGEYFCTVEDCDVGHSFPSIYGLRMHFHQSHIREEEKYFSCDHCDEKFSFKTERNKHVRTVHLKEYECDLCGRRFGSREKRDCHRRIHTGEKPFACHSCDYRAAKKFNLDMHLQAKHGDFGNNKNYLCAICNKQFVTVGRVRRHMAVIHADGRADSPRNKRRPRPPLPQQLEQFEGQEPQFVLQAVGDSFQDAEERQIHVLTDGVVTTEDLIKQDRAFITVTPALHITSSEPDA